MNEKESSEQEVSKIIEKLEKKAFRLGIIVGVAGALIGVAVNVLVRNVILIQKYRNVSEETETTEEKKTPKKNDSVVNTKTTLKMATIEKIVKEYYYQDVDNEALAEGVYTGMMESLGDPYSEYYTVDEMVRIREEGEGVYSGIGAYVNVDPDTTLPMIAGVMSGTPAEEAGLAEGDLIYKIDGKEVLGMSASDAVMLIKGEEHTTVHLTIVRNDEPDFLEMDVERRKIQTPTVKYEMLEDNIAYIQIKEFDDVTTDQFTEAMAVMKGQGMEGLILDLRSNGGGNVSTCVDIASQILPKGVVVYTEDKNGNRQDYNCDGKREFDKPIIVLVNGYTASASEILTGAIRDYGKGIVMGTQTYGKGIVQQIISLKDGSAIKVTVSKYFTPKGNDIHGVGITPDKVIEWDSEKYKEDGTDNQIEAAKEELRKQINK
ncbi:MAG: S41 family peptidase [Lachnospiraceae bacterium]|nr:S41 family peptidase [Lachnospiraceae bacterium]